MDGRGPGPESPLKLTKLKKSTAQMTSFLETSVVSAEFWVC